MAATPKTMKRGCAGWLLVAALCVACKDGGEPAAGDAPPAKAEAKRPAEPRATDPPARAAQLWGEVGTAHAGWPKATPEPTRGSKAHGTFTRISYNDVAKGALASSGAWPEGTIFLKENFGASADGKAGALEFVTVMSKEDGKWFWARYEADGTVSKAEDDAKNPGMPVAGDRDLKCPACHKIKGQRDHVIDTLLRG